jgi:hypothetical protein
MYQNFIIPYLSEAQHVSDDTPPIVRSLKLHWQPLIFHTWKVVGRVVGGRCQAVFRHSVPDNVHQLHVQEPSTYEKPEAASLVHQLHVQQPLHCLTTSTNYTSKNLPRMKNQMLPV